jgi:hypothetical protein
MAHDVFISYSAKDKKVAESICQELERDGVSCWIAPRNIIPGRKWGGSIIDAINGSKVMVLVFSKNANESQQILREVERSVNKGIPVIPFRIDEINPNKDLEYYIMTEHWLDAFTKPMEQHVQRLRETVRSLVPYKEKITEGNDGAGTEEGGSDTSDAGDELDHESRKAAEEIDRIREERGDEVVVPPEPVSKTKQIAAAVAALVVFAALSAYFGLLVVFIPVVCIIAAWWLIGNFRDTKHSPMYPALTLIGGHILWFIVGIISVMALTGQPDAIQLDASGTVIDALISAGLFAWLLLRPGKVSGVANVLGAVFFLIANISALSEIHEAMIVNGIILHCIFYAATLAALGYGILKLRKSAPPERVRSAHP